MENGIKELEFYPNCDHMTQDDMTELTIKDLEALEQEPCEDAISRQAVMDCFKKWQPYMATRLWDFEKELSKLPLVNPQEPKWTPVSERLPEEEKTVIASTLYGVYPETKYTKKRGWEWAYEAGSDYWVELAEVTAWMPLPEPYKAESEETWQITKVTGRGEE